MASFHLPNCLDVAAEGVGNFPCGCNVWRDVSALKVRKVAGLKVG